MTERELWLQLQSQNGIERDVIGMPISQGWYYFGSSDNAQDAHSATWFNRTEDIVDVAKEILTGEGDSPFENEAIYSMRVVRDGDIDGDGHRISLPAGKFALIMSYAVVYDPIRGWSATDWDYDDE